MRNRITVDGLEYQRALPLFVSALEQRTPSAYLAHTLRTPVEGVELEHVAIGPVYM